MRGSAEDICICNAYITHFPHPIYLQCLYFPSVLNSGALISVYPVCSSFLHSVSSHLSALFGPTYFFNSFRLSNLPLVHLPFLFLHIQPAQTMQQIGERKHVAEISTWLKFCNMKKEEAGLPYSVTTALMRAQKVLC